MIDIDSIAAAKEATQRVGIEFDDEGEPTAGFVIVGPDSQQYRDCQRSLSVNGIKRFAKKSERIDATTEEGASKAYDNTDQQNESLALAVTVDWFGFTKAGAPVPFDKETLRAWFKARPTWRQKVLAALENERGFLLPSPTSSASSPGTSSA